MAMTLNSLKDVRDGIKKAIMDALDLNDATCTNREACLLKARMFDMGLNIFDMLKLSDAQWAVLRVTGELKADMQARLAPLCRALPSLRAAPRAGGEGQPQAAPDDGWGSWPSEASAASPALLRGLAAGADQEALSLYPKQLANLAGQPGRQDPPGRPAGPSRIPQPVRLPEQCKHHKIPEGFWIDQVLVEHELHNEWLPLWTHEMFKRMISSSSSVSGVPSADGDAAVWGAAENPSLFWTDNPDQSGQDRLWVRGWWTKSKTSKCVQFGCIRCGHRTPMFYPGTDARGFRIALLALFGGH